MRILPPLEWVRKEGYFKEYSGGEIFHQTLIISFGTEEKVSPILWTLDGCPQLSCLHYLFSASCRQNFGSWFGYCFSASICIILRSGMTEIGVWHRDSTDCNWFWACLSWHTKESLHWALLNQQARVDYHWTCMMFILLHLSPFIWHTWSRFGQLHHKPWLYTSCTLCSLEPEYLFAVTKVLAAAQQTRWLNNSTTLLGFL